MALERGRVGAQEVKRTLLRGSPEKALAHQMAIKMSLEPALVEAFLEDESLATWCTQVESENRVGDYIGALTPEQRVLRAAYIKEDMSFGMTSEDLRRAAQQPQSAFSTTVRESLHTRDRTLKKVNDLLSQPLAESSEGSSGVRCSKCKSTEIRFEIAQTRSADEGSTVFCLCMQCQKRWRM